MAIDKDKIQAGNKVIEDYREAHRQLHSKPWHPKVSDEHEAIMQQLSDALKVIGFGSLQEYEDFIQDLKNGETLYREAPLLAVGLIAPAIGLGNALPGEDYRFPWYALTESNPKNKLYTFTYTIEREFNEALATGYEDAEIGKEIDLKFCEKNNISVTSHTWLSKRKYTFYFGKGTASFNICLGKSEFCSGQNMFRLLKLSVIDTCLDYGLQGEVSGNDVVVNGKKVAGGTNNHLSEIGFQRDAFIATIVVNHDFDAVLAQGALLHPKTPASEITSFSGELGYKVDPQEFKDRFLANVAKRFNLVIEEEEWEP